MRGAEVGEVSYWRKEGRVRLGRAGRSGRVWLCGTGLAQMWTVSAGLGSEEPGDSKFLKPL